MSKKHLMAQAIALRQKGWATPRIATELRISKSTAFQWVKDVALTDEQRQVLFKGKGPSWIHGVSRRVANSRSKRLRYQELGQNEVRLNAWEHAAFCMLFWAEGSKRRNTVVFTNCDERMLVFFVQGLKKFYDVENKHVSLTFQYHGGGKSEQEIWQHWKSVLDLQGCRVTKSWCKPSKSSKTKHPNGVCRVTVHNTEIANRIWGSIQGYIGFKDPDGRDEKKNQKPLAKSPTTC